MLRKMLLTAAGAAVVAVAAAVPAFAGGTNGVPPLATPPEHVVQVPVSFTVHNTNQTPVPCAADGRTYTVRGHIVAPEGALDHPDAATLYLHAVTLGEYYWNLDIPGYDYADQQARNGHVSVIIDRLGYGSSDKPAGAGTCFGSEATVAHQIIGRLRAGDYHTDAATAAKFSRVYTAGSSVGGLIANVEAYSFHDTDGVINLSWGDVAATPFTAAQTADVVARCLAGGDPDTPGYATFFDNARDEFYFNSAGPEVRRAVPPLHVDPCGQIESVPAGIAADVLHLGEIDVPVLVMFGSADAVFGPPALAGKQEAARYVGSPEVTLDMIPDASHYPLFESRHLQVVSDIDKWLDRRPS